MLDAFEAVVMTDPIHEAILVGVTDDQPWDFFDEVENNDGFFQVLAGVELTGSDDELTQTVLIFSEKHPMRVRFQIQIVRRLTRSSIE